VVEEEGGWGGEAFSGVTWTVVWTRSPRSGFGVGWGDEVSVVGGKGSSFMSASLGTAGVVRPGGRSRGVGAGGGGEETQVREGGGRTTGVGS
jgi:hypothetical protein